MERAGVKIGNLLPGLKTKGIERERGLLNSYERGAKGVAIGKMLCTKDVV